MDFMSFNFGVEVLFCLPTRKRTPFHFTFQAILAMLFGLGMGSQEWKISVTKKTVAFSILVAPSLHKGGETLPG